MCQALWRCCGLITSRTWKARTQRTPGIRFGLGFASSGKGRRPRWIFGSLTWRKGSLRPFPMRSSRTMSGPAAVVQRCGYLSQRIFTGQEFRVLLKNVIPTHPCVALSSLRSLPCGAPRPPSMVACHQCWTSEIRRDSKDRRRVAADQRSLADPDHPRAPSVVSTFCPASPRFARPTGYFLRKIFFWRLDSPSFIFGFSYKRPVLGTCTCECLFDGLLHSVFQHAPLFSLFYGAPIYLE